MVHPGPDAERLLVVSPELADVLSAVITRIRGNGPAVPLVTAYDDTLANPYIAAERGYVDGVIAPHETRVEVVKALRLLETKRETLPPKKHGNIPL